MPKAKTNPTTYCHLSADECAAQFPRLISAMKHAAILSSGEAACGLRDYRDARYASTTGRNPFPMRDGADPIVSPMTRAWGQNMLRYGGGEAVAHFGGPLAVIRAAIRCHHAMARPVHVAIPRVEGGAA